MQYVILHKTKIILDNRRNCVKNNQPRKIYEIRVNEMTELAVSKNIEMFSDMQVQVAAQMAAAGYDVVGIETSAGLESGQLAILMQDTRYKELSTEVSQEIASNDLETDLSWDSVEKKALASLSYDLAHHDGELTVMEKISVAKQANAARRRAGRLGEHNRRGNGEGVINGDVNNNTVINLQLPEVITDRLKKIENSSGEIYEHEAKEVFDPNEQGERLNVEDVEEIFGLDVTSPDRQFAADDDARMFDKLIEDKSKEEMKDDFSGFFAQQEG